MDYHFDACYDVSLHNITEWLNDKCKLYLVEVLGYNITDNRHCVLVKLTKKVQV